MTHAIAKFVGQKFEAKGKITFALPKVTQIGHVIQSRVLQILKLYNFECGLRKCESRSNLVLEIWTRDK